jgi:hypothetical protein
MWTSDLTFYCLEIHVRGKMLVVKSVYDLCLFQYIMQFNELYPFSSSSLGNAAREGNEKAVKILLRSGQRVDIGDNRGWTPLHEAAAANNTACLHLLLKKGTVVVSDPSTKIIFQNYYSQVLTLQHEL